MGWKFYVAVFLGNIVGTLIYRLIRWCFENKRGECVITFEPKRPIYLKPVTDKKVIERMENALSDTSKRDEALQRYRQTRSSKKQTR